MTTKPWIRSTIELAAASVGVAAGGMLPTPLSAGPVQDVSRRPTTINRTNGSIDSFLRMTLSSVITSVWQRRRR